MAISFKLNELPAGVTVGTQDFATIQIVDNDFKYKVSYAGATARLAAEASGELALTVRVETNQDPSIEYFCQADLDVLNETVEVRVSTADGTATADADYAPLSGLTLIFQATDFVDQSPSGHCYTARAEQTVTIMVTDDTVHEGATAETFTVLLSHDAGQRVEYPSPGATATVSITDDDAAPMPLIVADANQVNEGDSDLTVDLTVQMPGSRYALATALTLDFSTGTAQESTSTVPADYSVSVRRVMIAADSMADVAAGTVTVRNDELDEDPEEETIVVRLLDGATLLSSATITVSDDDDPAVSVEFGAASYPLAEDGTAVVSVSVSDDPEAAAGDSADRVGGRGRGRSGGLGGGAGGGDLHGGHGAGAVGAALHGDCGGRRDRRRRRVADAGLRHAAGRAGERGARCRWRRCRSRTTRIRRCRGWWRTRSR